MSRKVVINYTELAFAQLCLGINIVIAKSLVSYFPMLMLLSLRFLIGAIILTSMCKLTGMRLLQNKEGIRLVKKDWGALILQALCGGILFNLLMLSGLHLTSAANAGIITSCTPAAIALFSFVLLKERMRQSQIIAIALAVFGLATLSLGTASHHSTSSLVGDLLVLLAVVPEALFTVIAKWYGSHVKPLIMSTIISIFNAILFLPILIWYLYSFSVTSIPASDWLALLCYGLSGSVLFYIFWYRGLAHATASEAALFTSVMPISSWLLAALFLGESTNSHSITGMALVILSIFVGASKFKLIPSKWHQVFKRHST